MEEEVKNAFYDLMSTLPEHRTPDWVAVYEAAGAQEAGFCVFCREGGVKGYRQLRGCKQWRPHAGLVCCMDCYRFGTVADHVKLTCVLCQHGSRLFKATEPSAPPITRSTTRRLRQTFVEPEHELLLQQIPL